MENIREINKGTYVCAKFSDETLEALESFQELHEIPNRVPKVDMHCTIAFSRKFINYKPEYDIGYVATHAETKIFTTQKGKRALVLALENADKLKFRHDYANAIGATYDFPDYIPHVTVSYDIGVLDFPEGMKICIPFYVTKEVVEDLDLDWKPST